MVFVDGNVAETFAVLVQNVGEGLKKFHGRKNQVVEVKRVVLLQFLLIEFVNLQDVRRVSVAAVNILFAEFFGVNQFVFQRGNF